MVPLEELEETVEGQESVEAAFSLDEILLLARAHAFTPLTR